MDDIIESNVSQEMFLHLSHSKWLKPYVSTCEMINMLFKVNWHLCLLCFSTKEEKEELVTKNTQLQKELLNKDKHWEDKVTILMEEKTELENQRDSLKQRLDELEKEKEINKQKLQAVEKVITVREMTLDTSEKLLNTLELDQTKKDSMGDASTPKTWSKKCCYFKICVRLKQG